MEKRTIWQSLSNNKSLFKFYLLYKVTWILYRPLKLVNCLSTLWVKKFLLFSVYTNSSLQLCTFTVLFSSTEWVISYLFFPCCRTIQWIFKTLQSLLFLSQYCGMLWQHKVYRTRAQAGSKLSIFRVDSSNVYFLKVYICEQSHGMKWANLSWIILMIMAQVQHVLTIKILSSWLQIPD